LMKRLLSAKTLLIWNRHLCVEFLQKVALNLQSQDKNFIDLLKKLIMRQNQTLSSR
jgi:hypothetical protein